ncbi:adenylosuccinate synthase [Dactylosporangium fulvum]|uniref:Adenylosuccinate synthetase n=1 Tax=Dactylosporangium fulvum TaxID=53359 RepID=A0ABY5W852_9ACTN|nr:adenylosuccinate synthetase [Dactylosporangium fulvum]UWP84883.1 adenylosuccinate synthetase [Dactylosporangium fulvum]
MHVIVVDLGFGDCGKGTVVDHLCATREVHTVVRFNGGAQAAHTVVLADGRQHTFAQFGAGTLRPGVRTHLSRFMVVDPLALVAEAEHLIALGVHDVWQRLTVDRRALVATPYHREANRAKELARGADRHGSCGMGVGETMAYALSHDDDAPRVGDCADPPVLRRKLTALRARLGVGGPPVEDCVRAFAAFAATVPIVDGMRFDDGPCVFEGAQGVLLDEWHGFHPYTTWSTTTFANAEELLDGAPAFRLGVLRTVTTRHGAGPLVTEDPSLGITDPNNPANPWQGAFRVGHFDAVAHRYALEVCGGVDGLALTHLDLPVSRMCTGYGGVRLVPGPPGDLTRQEATTRSLAGAEPRYAEVRDWVTAVEDTLGAPVVVESWGPTAEDKKSADRLTS